MYTIDVNSGRSTKNNADVEETLVRINLEAADEIARQLRVRNIGGLVICDFIDMRSRKNQRRVLERLKESMKEDSAKCTILGMSEFGLVEMTRQRNRESLMQTLFTNCPYCNGSGLVKTHESLSRSLKKIVPYHQQHALQLVVHPELNHYLESGDKQFLRKLAKKLNADLEFAIDDRLHLNDFHFYSSISGKRLEV
jgi:ribonuclease G